MNVKSKKSFDISDFKGFLYHCVFFEWSWIQTGSFLHLSHSVTFLVQVFWLECIGEKNSSLTHFFFHTLTLSYHQKLSKTIYGILMWSKDNCFQHHKDSSQWPPRYIDLKSLGKGTNVTPTRKPKNLSYLSIKYNLSDS